MQLSPIPLLVLALVLASSCKSTAPQPEPTKPPNILLIVTDDQGWGELGARGHPWLRTPELDAMAVEGLTLERFYAAAPVCSPTRASLLTGRHPNRTRTFAWGYELPGEELTLAEVLTARGYRTAHFGKWHLGSVRATHPTSPGAQGFETWASSPNFFDMNPLLSEEGRVVKTHGEGSDVITDRAIQFLRSAHASDRPFLAVVWFGNPHLPHVALPEDLAAQAAAPEDARAYYAEIEAIDRNVGRLRAELRDLGVGQDTLTWFTSDNGPLAPGSAEAYETAGLRGRKGSLWEGGIRVPSLLTYPAVIEAGTRSHAVTGTVDVFPTLLALAGVGPPPGIPLDGSVLQPLWKENSETFTRLGGLGFWTLPVEGRPMHANGILAAQLAGEVSPEEEPPVTDLQLLEQDPLPGHAAWIDGPWKLLATPSDGGLDYALYNLEADPAETTDRAAEHSDRVAEMRRALEEWQGSIVAELQSR